MKLYRELTCGCVTPVDSHLETDAVPAFPGHYIGHPITRLTDSKHPLYGTTIGVSDFHTTSVDSPRLT